MLSPTTRGRPQKYGRPARAVTVTLPNDTLTKLAAIDADVGSAIVRLADDAPAEAAPLVSRAEIAQYGKRAVIIVTPVRALKRLKGVELVPIGDGRALISLAPSVSVAALELQVRDALDQDAVPEQEREVLTAIADILREARGTRRLSIEPRTIMVVVSRSRPAAAAADDRSEALRKNGRRPKKTGAGDRT